MDLRTITTTEGLQALQDDWRRLETNNPDVPYYVRFRFVEAWWDAFADNPDVELHVLCVVNNNRVVGIAPLSIRSEKRGDQQVRVLRFASHGDYMSVLVDVDASVNADTVFKVVMARIESDVSWDRVFLTNIPGTSLFANYALKSKYNSAMAHYIENPYIDLTAYDNFEDFESRSVPKGARKYRNKLYRECDVRFTIIDDGDPQLLERIAALHRAEKQYLIGEKDRADRRSLFEDPFRFRHIRNLFANTSDDITFTYELPDGELLGYRTCYRDGRVLLSWNSAYNPEYESYRIGKALQYDILQHLFAHDLADRFDLGAGRYAWKFEWTSSFTSTYRLRMQLTSSPPAGTDRPGKTGKATPEAGARRDPAPVMQTTAPPTGGRLVLGAALMLARRTRRVLRSRRPRKPSTDVQRGARRTPPAIWYVPHPDDEALYMAGSLVGSGDRRNIVVLLTQGGASNAVKAINAKLQRPLSICDFMESRVREFRAATRHLGVDRRDVVLFDHPDGDLDTADVYEIILNMERQYPGARHNAMSYLDPHRDHRAVGQALRRAFDGKRVTDCLFHLPIPVVDETLGSSVALDADTKRAKRAALDEYQLWEPDRGRYAVGTHSVGPLMRRQYERPTERTHGPRYEAPDGQA